MDEPLFLIRHYCSSGASGLALRSGLSTITPFERLAFLQRLSMVISNDTASSSGRLRVLNEADAAARTFFLMNTLEAMQTLDDLSTQEVLPHLPDVRDLVKDSIKGKKWVEPWKNSPWVQEALSKCEARLEEASWKRS